MHNLFGLICGHELFPSSIAAPFLHRPRRLVLSLASSVRASLGHQSHHCTPHGALLLDDGGALPLACRLRARPTELPHRRLYGIEEVDKEEKADMVGPGYRCLFEPRWRGTLTVV